MLQTTESTISDLFKDYAITGFLPNAAPLTKLSNPYYSAWEELSDRLPTLIKTNEIRNKIDTMPICSTEHLKTEPEWRRAYVIMGYLSHSYIWGGDKPSEVCTASHSNKPAILTEMSTETPSVNFKALP
jgi:indoleamine 2,3-dioxygenase